MRANRRTDTKPELALRHALHRLGYRYRKDYRLDLAGGRRVRPDIAFTARKVAVFVDGCFWHACPEHGSKPRANQWYWGPKLIKNVERDRINDAALILAGWTVVRLWEHVALDEAVAAVVAALTANGAPTANGATSESSARDTSNAVATSSAVGQDQPGQDQPGQDRAGYDQAGYDRAGYDQAGYDQAGPRESPAAGDDSLS
jgi:DNA mismatch endonuclease (patch repair protein)